MELGKPKIGELVAAVGVVLGFVALWTTVFERAGYQYKDDGTYLTALIIALGLAACCLAASLLLGKMHLDLAAAAAGAVAFGLFLYQPSLLAFKFVDKFSWGAWFGFCSVLVPLGAGTAHLWHKRSDAKASGVTLATVAAAIGLVLIVIGIWKKISVFPSISYWNISSSGHALGLLLLILAIASALLIAVAVTTRNAGLADVALIVSGITVGVAIAEGVFGAFGNGFFPGGPGTGAWLELAGGLVLLISLIVSRVVKLPELIK
jgi:hypothetical protein